MRDLTTGITPDLGACALVMRRPVVVVRELVEHTPLALALHAFGQIARAFHAFRFGHQNQFGPVGLHRLAPLNRQVVGHDQHHAVTADGCRHGERDAGVARGGLDQRVTGPDLAAALGALDHGERRPVFHRPRRVVALELAQDEIAAARLLGARQALQADQGCVADRGVDSRVIGSVGHREMLRAGRGAAINGGWAARRAAW